MQFVLYIIGHNAYVHIRGACTIGRFHMFVPVELRIILVPWEGVRASETIGLESLP